MENISEDAKDLNTVHVLSNRHVRAGIFQRTTRFVREMFAELFRYRELLLTLAWRDIQARYKHSLIGAGWAIFVPVIQMVVFGTVLQKVAKIDTGDLPYPIFLYCGLVPWQFFEQSVLKGTQSLVVNSNLVTKIYFAREVLPCAAILGGAFDFVIASTVLAGMMVWYKIAPIHTLAWVPLIILIQIVFSSGVVLVLSMVNLFYRDVGQAITVMMRAWMFLTTVMYPLDNTGLWRVVNTLNPMTPIITAYRDVILNGASPDWSSLGPAAALSAAVLLIAWIVFHTNEFRFAENV